MQKRKLELLLLMLIVLFVTAACQSKPINLLDIINKNEFSTTSTNSVIHQAQADEPEDCLLYIIHAPTDAEMAELLSYTIIKQDNDAPLTLLAPRDKESLMKIFSLSYNEETETYERVSEVWSLDSTSKGFIAAAELYYGSSGAPTYELYIESNDAYGSYFFEVPADPDESLPHIDYLLKEGTLVTTHGLD